MTPSSPEDRPLAALRSRIAALEARVVNGDASLDEYGELVRCRRALARRESGASPSAPARQPDEEAPPEPPTDPPTDTGRPRSDSPLSGRDPS